MKIMLLLYFLSGVAAGCVLQFFEEKPPLRHQALFSAVNGLLFLFAGMYVPWGTRLVLAWIFFLGLSLETYVDLRSMLIPDEVLLVLAAAGPVYVRIARADWQASVQGLLAGAVFLGLIHIISKGGLGLGDVKLAAVLGIWLGLSGMLVSLALAFVSGGVAALVLCLSHRASCSSRIPFGPFMGLGALLSFFFSGRILDWYLSCFM